jgi:hypothetical protein
VLWARPFRIHLIDGRVWHGTQFPSGLTCVAHPGVPGSVFTAGLSLEDVLGAQNLSNDLEGARVQWADKEA